MREGRGGTNLEEEETAGEYERKERRRGEEVIHQCYRWWVQSSLRWVSGGLGGEVGEGD